MTFCIPRNKENHDVDENGHVPSDNHSVLVTSDALPFVAYCAPVRFSKILTMLVISMMRIKMASAHPGDLRAKLP